MKKLRLMSLAFVLVLSGCKYVDIKDGKVPAEYLTTAKTLEGVYKGSMEGIPAEIAIKFNEDVPKLTYTDAGGNDIIRSGCGSTIGLLEGVLVDEDGNNGFKVKQADFDFNAGNCHQQVRGRQVSLDFNNNNGKMTVNLRLLDHVETHYNCYWEPGNHNYPGHQICNPYYVSYYRMGRFSKN